MQTFWATLNNVTFEEKLLWLLFGQLLVKIGLLLITLLGTLMIQSKNKQNKLKHNHALTRKNKQIGEYEFICRQGKEESVKRRNEIKTNKNLQANVKRE